MGIQLICVGKLKENYWIQALKEYTKRLRIYTNLEICELPDEKVPESLSSLEKLKVRKQEGQKILATIAPHSHVIALVIEGELWSSEQLARHLQNQALYGPSQITFVIGGSLGLSSEVIMRCNKQLSFGKFTYPHQCVRILLMEQIYRAFKINRGEPYHK